MGKFTGGFQMYLEEKNHIFKILKTMVPLAALEPRGTLASPFLTFEAPM